MAAFLKVIYTFAEKGMHTNYLYYLFAAAALLATAGCQQSGAKTTIQTVTINQDNPPAWLAQKIAAFQADKPANPPIKIYRYQYQNQPVYYVTSRCCDIPSQLFSVEGQQLCQPDGGYTGKGDGKCTDFFETRTNETLIWEDTRNR